MGDLGTNLAEHFAGLRRYARALLAGRTRSKGFAGEAVDADELVQECLVRALSRVRQCGEVRDLRAYLFAILHNVYVDHVTAGRRMVAGDAATDFESVLSTPPQQQARLEARDLVRALARLPESQRRVVLLVGMEGLSYQQVADILGVPIGTVMSRLSRGREALRQLTTNTRTARRRPQPARRVARAVVAATGERAGTMVAAAARG